MGELQTDRSTTDIVSIRVNYLLFLNKNMSQRALAFRMGMKPNTLSGKITGLTRWNLDEIVTLADTFQVSADYMLGRAPIESAEPINEAVPASEETGTVVVAGRGFEPLTSGL